MDLLNIFCNQESSVLAKDEMPISYVVEEGPLEDVLNCNDSENMDSNMWETLAHVHTLKKMFLAHLLQLIQILPFEVDLSQRLR